VAFVIVSILLMMSLMLMATTVFPGLDVRTTALGMGAALLALYAVAGTAYRRVLRERPPEPALPKARTANWRMPPLNLLRRPTWSRSRLVSMYVLRGYLLVAVVLLLVKAIELGTHT
jgi:hypothetical protein